MKGRDGVTDFGFKWDPMNVVRTLEIRNRKQVRIETDHRKLEVTVSPQGQNMVVYLDGVRMVPERPKSSTK